MNANLPSIRSVNGKDIYFYSLCQIESIIPPEKRMRARQNSHGYLSSVNYIQRDGYINGMKARHFQ